MRKFIISVLMLVLFVTSVNAHSWYDRDCCSDNDCEPVKVHTDEGGNFAILKNGKKWYIDKPLYIRPSQDENYHVCVYQNMVWCLYVPTGY